MTQLEKAEAVLAMMRGEVGCSFCHRYVERCRDIVWIGASGHSQLLCCRACWLACHADPPGTSGLSEVSE